MRRENLNPTDEARRGGRFNQPHWRGKQSRGSKLILGVTCPSLLNYRNFPNVKNPRPAACGVQPSFPSPSALSAIPTRPVLSANKDHPKGPQRTSKIEQENGRVRFLHVTCVFLCCLFVLSQGASSTSPALRPAAVGRSPGLRPQGAAHLGYNLDKPSSGSKRRSPQSQLSHHRPTLWCPPPPLPPLTSGLEKVVPPPPPPPPTPAQGPEPEASPEGTLPLTGDRRGHRGLVRRRDSKLAVESS